MEHFRIDVDGNSYSVETSDSELTVDGEPIAATVERLSGDTYSVIVNGRSFELTVDSSDERTTVGGAAATLDARVLDRVALLIEESGGSSAATHAAEVRSPMPGLVLKLEVAQGDDVSRGDGLLVLEAMKMENEIFASTDAVVGSIHVEEGEAVVKGQLLVTLA